MLFTRQLYCKEIWNSYASLFFSCSCLFTCFLLNDRDWKFFFFFFQHFISTVKTKSKRVFGTLFSNCNSVIAIHNHWIPLKFFCLVHQIWVKIEILTWILCGSHGKFENSLEGIFGSKIYSNSDWIYVGPSFITVIEPTHFSPHFLSLWRWLQTLLSLFLWAITEGKAPPYTTAARRHLAQLIAKKIPNQNLSSSTNKNTTRPKKERKPLKKKLKSTNKISGAQERTANWVLAITKRKNGPASSNPSNPTLSAPS